MRRVSGLVVVAGTLATMSLATPASAAPPVAIATLPSLPKPPAPKDGVAPVGLKVVVTEFNADWHQVNAATEKGYCILPQFGGRSASNWSSSTGEDEATFAVRLVEKDGTATFEKSRLSFDAKSGTLRVGVRVSVTLAEVVRSRGVVVWGYRDGQEVVLVARGMDGGFDSPHRSANDDGMLSFLGTDGCPYSVARLDAAAAKGVVAGSSAQITGNLPSTGKGKDAVVGRGFIVDASVSKVAREPDPMLAVRVRLREE